MKLLTFIADNRVRPGVIDGGRVVDLMAAGLPVTETGDLMRIVRGGDAMLERVMAAIESPDRHSFDLDDVSVIAPLFVPPKIVAVGLNYTDHCEEAGLPLPKEPVLFSKFTSSVVGPYADISWPTDIIKEVDYEVELGVVIGRRGRNIKEEQALDYVCGYTVVNDVTARDLQFAGDRQWDRSKSLDTFCPWGPYIVTRDEIEDPHDLELRTLVNGKEMQKSTTRNMIFTISQIIAYASRGTTLMPGDLIPTGTPFGVGYLRKPPVFLKHGDVVECSVEKVGKLVNKVNLE